MPENEETFKATDEEELSDTCLSFVKAVARAYGEGTSVSLIIHREDKTDVLTNTGDIENMLAPFMGYMADMADAYAQVDPDATVH